ncbi:MAG TPA: RDD family protein [Puia sp.]|nr:RDD family protein [Puia sp.]
MEDHYPSLIDRVQSIFIDGILIILLMFVFSSVFDHFGDPPNWVRVVLFFAIWAIYEPLLVVFGCTLGQYIKGLRVKNIDDTNRRIGVPASFLRYLLKSTLGWLSFLTINMNKERRAIHDLATGSVVIVVRQKVPAEIE